VSHSEQVCEHLNRIDQDGRLMAFKSMSIYLEDKTNEHMADAVGGVVGALASGGVPRSAIDVPTVRNFIDFLGKGNYNAWLALFETAGFDPDDDVCAELIAHSPAKDKGLTISEVVDGQLLVKVAFVPKTQLLELGREDRLGTPKRIASFDTRTALRAKLVLDRMHSQAAAA
jgi:hypothetical protein